MAFADLRGDDGLTGLSEKNPARASWRQFEKRTRETEACFQSPSASCRLAARTVERLAS